MSQTQSEYFQTHAVDGQLTDAQMVELLSLPEGDTGFTPDSGEPDAASAEADKTTQVDDSNPQPAATGDKQGEPEANADPEPVLLAKDGKHTIPYEKLVEAREAEKHWKAQAEATQRQLAELQNAAQQRADAGQAPTATDNAVATATAAIESGVSPDIFGDFSEEALSKGIQKLVQMGVEQQLAAIRGELAQVVEPLKATQAKSATEQHYQAIYTAHPDADSIAESKELADWIAKQPTFARTAYTQALQAGTTQEVIELFSAFKDATGTTQAPPAKPDVAAAAKAAIAAAKTAPPTSLSEIPAGSPVAHDEATAMLEMSSTSLMKSFEGKSPEQIEAMLSRVM